MYFCLLNIIKILELYNVQALPVDALEILSLKGLTSLITLLLFHSYYFVDRTLYSLKRFNIIFDFCNHSKLFRTEINCNDLK